MDVAKAEFAETTSQKRCSQKRFSQKQLIQCMQAVPSPQVGQCTGDVLLICAVRNAGMKQSHAESEQQHAWLNSIFTEFTSIEFRFAEFTFTEFTAATCVETLRGALSAVRKCTRCASAPALQSQSSWIQTTPQSTNPTSNNSTESTVTESGCKHHMQTSHAIMVDDGPPNWTRTQASAADDVDLTTLRRRCR